MLISTAILSMKGCYIKTVGAIALKTKLKINPWVTEVSAERESFRPDDFTVLTSILKIYVRFHTVRETARN